MRCWGLPYRRLVGLLCLAAFSPAWAQVASPKHPLTIDDVLATEHLDGATLSPDGAWVAAVVQRGAGPGEVGGRTAYEVDPSRDDLWLVSTATGERRRITDGRARAAGYWCATWSPDGRRIALLSTQPEGGEPHGGDNVRLYVWDRATGRLKRVSDDALMTQTRYGSPLHQLDLRARGGGPHACSEWENAPFVWLDNHRLLTVTLPRGEVSGLIDQYALPFRTAARDAALLREGMTPTVEAVGSGAAVVAPDPDANGARLRIVDVATGEAWEVASVPAYPFRGALNVAVSPDSGRLAVMATVAALRPEAGRSFPHSGDSEGWTVERRLGFVDLAPGAAMRWVTLPAEARLPLELYGWSPDGRRVAIRARGDAFAPNAPLFVVDTRSGEARRLGPGAVAGVGVRIDATGESPVLWADERRLVARMQPTRSGKADWWLLGLAGGATNLTGGGDHVPAAFRRTATGGLTAIRDDELVRLDVAAKALAPVARLDGAASFVATGDQAARSDQLLVTIVGKDGTRIERISSATGKPDGSLSLPAAADLLDADAGRGQLLWSESGRAGLFLRAAKVGGAPVRELLALDTFMGRVDWGETRLIDYQGADGKPLKGALILPPGYRPGHRYPTLVWVYQDHQVRGLDDYFLDPFLPGVYNLQLYAARGYVVLIPSMPIPSGTTSDAAYARISGDVLPAVDKLVSLGISDPDRVGVFGQSRGGYTVYALVTQTDRFRAAVAMAGISDLAGFYGQFDPLGRGYPGIAHEASDNWAEVNLWGLHAPPSRDPQAYARVSPLTHADRVTTPLLLIHGDADMRGSVEQAEQFFAALYAIGRTARLLRYGGESHSLAQSPADVRDIYRETLDWFDRFLAPCEGAGAAALPSVPGPPRPGTQAGESRCPMRPTDGSCAR